MSPTSTIDDAPRDEADLEPVTVPERSDDAPRAPEAGFDEPDFDDPEGETEAGPHYPSHPPPDDRFDDGDEDG